MNCDIKLSKIRFDLEFFKRLIIRELGNVGDTEYYRKEFIRLCFKYGICPKCYIGAVVRYKENEGDTTQNLMSCTNCFSTFHRQQNVT